MLPYEQSGQNETRGRAENLKTSTKKHPDNSFVRLVRLFCPRKQVFLLYHMPGDCHLLNFNNPFLATSFVFLIQFYLNSCRFNTVQTPCFLSKILQLIPSCNFFFSSQKKAVWNNFPQGNSRRTNIYVVYHLERVKLEGCCYSKQIIQFVCCPLFSFSWPFWSKKGLVRM